MIEIVDAQRRIDRYVNTSGTTKLKAVIIIFY